MRTISPKKLNDLHKVGVTVINAGGVPVQPKRQPLVARPQKQDTPPNVQSANAPAAPPRPPVININHPPVAPDPMMQQVCTSGCDLNLNNTSIASGQTVSLSSFTFTAGN